MDVSGVLDSWVTLVAVTGHHCSQHSLENPPVASHGRPAQLPQIGSRSEKLTPGDLEEHPNR